MKRYREVRIWGPCRFVLGKKVKTKLKIQTEAGLEVALKATLNSCCVDSGCYKAPPPPAGEGGGPLLHQHFCT